MKKRVPGRLGYVGSALARRWLDIEQLGGIQTFLALSAVPKRLDQHRWNTPFVSSTLVCE
jgi:hypothetical protein